MTRAPLPWPKGEIVVATRATLLAALAVASGACGGAPTGGAASAGQPSGDAARCLAAAGAKHARKPSEPYRIGAKHILVRYGGARGAPATVTRTREQACLRAEEALASLKAGDGVHGRGGQVQRRRGRGEPRRKRRQRPAR